MGLAPAAKLARKKAPINILVYAKKDDIIGGMGKKKTPNPHAQALGSLGGKARAKNLSPEERSRIAKLAVQARERKRAQQHRKGEN